MATLSFGFMGVPSPFLLREKGRRASELNYRNFELFVLGRCVDIKICV
jgi:hypothetical protein